MHLEREAIRQRAARFHAREAQFIVDGLEENVANILECWAALYDNMGMYTARRHREMAECLLQWRAYLINSWHMEIEQLHTGRSPYDTTQ
jgi:hypothetical protein